MSKVQLHEKLGRKISISSPAGEKGSELLSSGNKQVDAACCKHGNWGEFCMFELPGAEEGIAAKLGRKNLVQHFWRDRQDRLPVLLLVYSKPGIRGYADSLSIRLNRLK